jgi:hypothetical protein
VIKPPTKPTLKKYGLTLASWRRLLLRGGRRCHLCGREPSTGRLCIDHDHVKGWKKLPDLERAAHVRGLVCWTCNHYLIARNTVRSAQAVYTYLIRHDIRRDNPEVAPRVATDPPLAG